MPPLLDSMLKDGDGFRPQVTPFADAVNWLISRSARLPSLYSDFQLQRQSNPDGFSANYLAWMGALTKASRSGSLPVEVSNGGIFSLKTGDALLQLLETKDLGRPLALGAVIDEALSRRQLMPCDDFLSESRSIYERNWTVQPWWLLSWLVKHMNPFESRPGHLAMPKGHFIIFENLEYASKLLSSRLGGAGRRTDRTYPMEVFQQRVGEVLGLSGPLPVSDAKVLLKHLSRDTDEIRYNDAVVVFKTERETDRLLSSEDIAIADLKSAISELQKQIDLLSDSIAACTDRAKDALAKQNRPIATIALKSRRQKETALTQRAESLSQLEEVFNSIEQATDHLKMVQTMKQSTTVLQDLQAQLGGIDTVYDVVERLKDETQKVAEVEDVFQEAQQQGSNVDDEEVEEELQAMLHQAQGDEAAKDAPMAQDFPRVPEGVVHAIKDTDAEAEKTTSDKPASNAQEKLLATDN